MRNENRHGWWPVNQLGAWRRIPPGAVAPAGSRARRAARYLLLVPIVALVALLLVTAMSSERPQAQAQSGDVTLEADADCQVPPTGLESTHDADEAGVVLTWLAPAGCTPAGYAVYRRNMSEDGSRMQQLATVGGDTLTYTDTDVEAGESYRYRVRSNDLGPRSDHTTIDVPEAEPEPAPRSDDRVVRVADPMFSAATATISVPENTASGTNVGDAITATDTDLDTLSYHLSGTDTSSFSIVSTSGQLQTLAALNFEVKSSYSVTVGVRDSMSEMADDDTIAVTINVTNVNEPPTITSGSTSESVSENTATSTVIETYEASDPDTSATLTWSLSGDDAGDFVITKNASGQGELKFMNVPNYESPADNGTDNSYNVTVGVRDGLNAAGGTDTAVDAMRAVTITVSNVDEPGTVAISGAESGGSTLTASVTDDPDGGVTSESWRWARGDSAGGTFNNISGVLGGNATYVLVAADVGKYLRATASYTDPEGSGKSAFMVTGQIDASNSEPTFAVGSRTLAVDENSPSGTSVGNPTTASDSDNDTLTYTLSGADSGSFTVDSNGQISTKSGVTYNYETKITYSVTLNVRDNKDAAGGTDSANDASVAVTIRIRNVDEAGTVAISGTESGGSTLTASVTDDPDGGVTNESWRWARGDSAGGTFNNISGVLGGNATYVLVAADVGKYLRATASYTDDQGMGKSATSASTGQIGASNAVPTFDDGAMTTRTVPENSATGTNVGSVVDASDTDTGDTLTYSLRSPTGSTDASSFTVDGNGQIKTTGATYNFEATKNSYTVIVDVRDSKDAAGNADTATDDSITVTINLTNVNEAPTVTGGSTTTSFPENSTDAVGTYTASDVDASDTPDTLTWSVEPADDGALFAITTNSDGEGVLTFAASPDFEDKQDAGTNNVYDVMVKVADGGSLSDTRAVAVTVTNVNEAPEITTTGTTYTAPSFDENGTAVVATYQATDVDDGSNLTWSLDGEDKDFFTITKNSSGDGELEFANPPDYEMPADDADNDGNPPDNVYDITVKVVDNHSPQGSDTLPVAVTVEDVNETPVVSGDAGPDFDEIEFDVDGSTLDDMDLTIATYTAADQENDTITWSLSGDDASHFTITKNAAGAGVLTFRNPTPSTILKPADYDTPVDTGLNNGYDIEVRATDDNAQNGKTGTKTGTFDVTVTVTNVDETPEITGGDDAPGFVEIEWDADPMAVDLTVSTYTARDEETETITWSRAGTDSSAFTIDPNSGVLSFVNPPNYEMPTDADTDSTDGVDDSMDNVYEIVVKATDGNLSPNTPRRVREYPVTVTVTNVDETPEITNPPPNIPNYPETPYDSDVDRGIIATFTARDEEGQDITWSLTSGDAGLFDITENASGAGELTWSTVGVPDHKRPDYERPEDSDGNQKYTFSVSATDTATPPNTASWVFSLDVVNVNERPELTGDTITRTVTYNENDTVLVADYNARDEEGEVTWSLTGADSGDFAIDSDGTVTFANTPSYEMPTGSQSDGTDIDGNVYKFTVVATDILSGPSRLTATAEVTVTVADLEEPGIIEVGNRNPAVGDRIIFTLTDPDGGIDISTPIVGAPPPITWDIERRLPGGSWQSIPTAHTLATTYEYLLDEDQTGDEIRAVVTYIDRRGAGKSAESEATAAVTADPIVNAPPRFTFGEAGTQNIPETAADEDVGIALTAKDRDGDTLTWGLEDTAASDLFEIHPSTGQLRTAQALDFETGAGRLFLNVTLHDGKDEDGNVEAIPVVDVTSTVTITVTDVEEPGVVTLSNDEPGVDVEVDATLSDGDGSISGLTWQWARSEDGRTGWFNIGGPTSSSSYTTVPADADFYLRARASYTDGHGSDKTAAAVTALRVFGENQRPTFPSTENGQRTVAENTRAGVSIGAPVAAEDPEDDGLTYLLTGPDAAAFSVVSSTGQLRTSEALDFEMQSSYRFTIEVHDGQDGLGNPSTLVDDTRGVTVTLENVEEPGTVTLTGTFQARVEVTAALSDPDIPRGITWQWSRSPNGRTSWVNIATGDAYTPELEEVGSYLRATASYTDGHGSNTKEARQVSARVGDPPPVNSDPVFPSTEDGRREVPENSVSDTFVGDPVEATDLNADLLAYSLSGPDADLFTIAPQSGQLSVATNVTDYEGKRTYRVTVSVSDQLNQFGDPDDVIDDTINVVITLTDVNEAPVVTGDTAPSFSENARTPVATYSAADPERDTLTWSVNISTFWISNRGQLYFVTPPHFQTFGDRNDYEVAVTATDDGGLSGTLATTVTVTDVEDEGVVTITPPRGWVDFQTEFNASVADADGGVTSIEWQWARSSNRSSSGLYTVTAADAGQYLRATATYTDRRGSNKTASAVLRARIGDVRPATNTAPAFEEDPVTRTIGQGPAAGRAIGAPVRATDPDTDDILTYALSGTDADDFDIDTATGQLRTKAVLDPLLQEIYTVTVSVHDGFGPSYNPSSSVDDSVAVTITVTAVSTPIITGVGVGGGGGGGPSGPTPSDIEFEWNVSRDIEELDSGNDTPAGAWSDGTTLWLLDNASGAGDAVYAYDLESGERVEEREFELDETNRAPRGIWSDGTTIWVSDSGQDRLFAYDLASGERLPDSDIALTERNADPRGIWSDGANMWVLDGGKNALFAYDLPSGERLTEYSLDPSNDDPRGLWSDGVSLWVSDDGAKRLFAYRLPVPSQEERAADEEPPTLERVGDEEFTELSSSSNNSPRGIWSDGDVMYVADESDDRVYSYNMPDAIDARLASLTLSGVDIGEFSGSQTEYEGVPADGVTETTVEAETVQSAATAVIAPADSDEDIDGYQVALDGLDEVTVTVTSADESRTRVYRVRLADAGMSADCLRGAVTVGFSLLVSEGGSVEDLEACAQGRSVTALYVPHEGEYVPYILGAPEFVNEAFVALFPDGLPALTPLIAKSEGPASPAPASDDVPEFGPDCLRGAIASGFSLVLYEGGSVDDLDTCAQGRDVSAVYALVEGEYVPYILGAPGFANEAFVALFPDGLAPVTPLIAKRD